MDVHVETDADAPRELLWKVLTDLPRFRCWNPFIANASGKVAVGERVSVRPRTALGVRLAFHPIVTVCDAPHELRWKGELGSPRLARGEHVFRIDARDGGTRIVQHMTFEGILPRLFAPLVARVARRGFAAMNEALATRAHALTEETP